MSSKQAVSPRQRVESRFSDRTGITTTEPVPVSSNPDLARVRVLWADGSESLALTDDLRFLGDAADDERPDRTDARAYVETSARNCIGDLKALTTIAEDPERGGALTEEELESLGVEIGPDGLVDADSAIETLDALPLAVEAMTTFEVVLGCGGPDRRLCFECTRERNGQPEHEWCEPWEIRRVFYIYSWEGSAEFELTGADREIAEAFGRRVVPGLGE